MSKICIEFVKFFMAAKLREEIEDEIEIDTAAFDRERILTFSKFPMLGKIKEKFQKELTFAQFDIDFDN